MSAALRFLGLAVVGWAGLRAASLGLVPGIDGFTLRQDQARAATPPAGSLPPIAATQFPPLEAPGVVDPRASAANPLQPLHPLEYAVAGRIPVPLYYYQPLAVPPRNPSWPEPPRPATPILPTPQPLFYSPVPQLDDWPLSRIASAALPARRSAAAAPQQSLPPGVVQAKLDRLQLTAWAMLRGQPGQLRGPTSLASAGTLGGSQAGARLTYALDPRLALSLRSSSPVGGRGGEIAGGIRLTPFRTIPVSLTAERRQRIGRFGGGRSAFALFLEGGVYQRPVGWGFDLDAYAQAGLVGARSRDLFADGGLSLSRPLFRNISGGFGVWGGVQPGIYRIDAGPRISMKVRRNVRVHVDWRQRLAGNAEPGSGPAVTLAADF